MSPCAGNGSASKPCANATATAGIRRLLVRAGGLCGAVRHLQARLQPPASHTPGVGRTRMPDTRRRIAVLGSTGSIGRQTLDVVRAFPDHFQVVALAARSNVAL